MTWDNGLEKSNERLWRLLDELDAEMEAEGVEDATAWERWDEYENAIYVLAERRSERWQERAERWAEFAQMAEEAALVELEQLGFVAPGFKRNMWDFDPDEVVCFYEYGTEWDGFGGISSFDEGCWPEERPLYELF